MYSLLPLYNIIAWPKSSNITCLTNRYRIDRHHLCKERERYQEIIKAK